MSGLRPSGTVLLALLLSLAAAPAADEAGLWGLWTRHATNTTDHAAVVAPCAAFRARAGGDALAPVAAGLEAWHRLAMGDTNAAIAIWESQSAASSNGTAVTEAAADMARAWLTRLDMERVRAALRVYYRRRIAFPAALDALAQLPPAARPPLTDRWGKPWDYRLDAFRQLPSLRDQKYALSSPSLGPDDTLAAALAKPAAGTIPLEPLRAMPVPGGTPSFEFASGTGRQDRAVMTVGSRGGGVALAFAGERLLVLADRTNWKVVPRP